MSQLGLCVILKVENVHYILKAEKLWQVISSSLPQDSPFKKMLFCLSANFAVHNKMTEILQFVRFYYRKCQ